MDVTTFRAVVEIDRLALLCFELQASVLHRSHGGISSTCFISLTDSQGSSPTDVRRGQVELARSCPAQVTPAQTLQAH